MPSRHIPLGPGREFDLIRELVRRWGASAAGIGDDAALLDVPPGERLVVSTDSSVENVHFRRGWLTPWEIGYRATAAALSDLAAMAAHPLGIVVALAIPPRWRDEVGELGDGIAACASRCGVAIVGGDTTRGAELALTITVLGAAAAPLARSGVQVGDRIYVTGRFGGPLLALQALARGDRPSPEDRARFATPVPRIREARWLAAHGARAALDISDGLLADLRHMAAASGLALSIALDRLPTVAGITPRRAAESGEEYEVAIASPAPLDVDAFERVFGIPLTEIGVAIDGDPGRVAATYHGEFVDLVQGYDHFST